MSHLHIPDGVLPPLVWIVGALLAVLALAWSLRVTRAQGPREIAFQSALGGIMLAVMAIPVPITAFDYCMTLAGPVGVLLGAAGAFQASFVVTVILALMGQGGFSVIGLNTLVLGTGAALARPLYVALVRRWSPAASMATATAVSQLFSSALWVGILVVSVRVSPSAVREHEVAHALTWLRARPAARRTPRSSCSPRARAPLRPPSRAGRARCRATRAAGTARRSRAAPGWWP